MKKKFRFLGIFMNIPSFSKFRRNIPAKKVEKFRRNFRKFRAGIPSFSDSPLFLFFEELLFYFLSVFYMRPKKV
jgi:hypothetical protein